jgi:ribose transport system substrate-binding protein
MTGRIPNLTSVEGLGGKVRGMISRRWLVALLGLVFAVALVACGDDEEEQATAADSGASSVPAKVQKFVDTWEKKPTSINIDTPLKGEPATGKKIVQLKCSVAECQEIYDGLKKAADAVGWTTQDVNMGPTPEEVNQAFEQALTLDPDGIVISGIPVAVYKTYLDQAKKRGIPVVNIATVDEATGIDGNGLIATVNGGWQTKLMGTLTGNFIVQDSGGKDANVALITVPDFPTLKPWLDETKSVIESNCKSCKTTVVNAEVTDLGAKLPQTIVSTIQQDPEIDYVALAFSGMAVGVRPALNEAGFNSVKVVGEGSNQEAMDALRNDEHQMWAALTTPMQGWYAIDALLRFFNDQDMSDVANGVPMPTQILTPETIKSIPEGSYDEPEDNAEQFKKLWGVQ